MPGRLSRNALLVKFFSQAYRGLPRTNLVKYVYEADVLAREYIGRPISTLTYHRDKYGPYDAAIENAVEELIAGGYVEEKKERWSFRRRWGAYKRLFDQHRPVAFDFDLAESAVLNYVVTNYLNMPFDEFLKDVVYETAPMKAGTPLGELLPMDRLNNTGTERVGFQLSEVLRAEEEGRRGNCVTLSAFVDELRAQAPA
jgi:Protein of unknown function (DUF4065)